MSKLLISAVLASAVLACAAASAEEYYTGATVSNGGKLTFRNPLNGKSATADPDAIFKWYGGVELTSNFALEAAYSNGAKAHFDKSKLGMAEDPSFSLRSFSLAARATHHFNDDWSVFGKLGVARSRYKAASAGESDAVSDTKALLGVGLAYNVTPKVAVTLEFERLGRTRQEGINIKENTLQLGVKAGF